MNKTFDKITISAEVGSGKECNRIFDETIECLKVNADECVFIDNKEKNLIVPKNIGMNVMYFDHKERNYKKLINEIKKLLVIL